MESFVPTIFIVIPILDMRTWDSGRQGAVEVGFMWPGLQEEGRGVWVYIARAVWRGKH